MTRSLPFPDRKIFNRAEYRELLRQEALTSSKTAVAASVQDFALFSCWGFELDQIKTPVAVFHSQLDANVPMNHARQLAKQIPKAKLHCYIEHGHLSILGEVWAILNESVSPNYFQRREQA